MESLVESVRRQNDTDEPSTSQQSSSLGDFDGDKTNDSESRHGSLSIMPHDIWKDNPVFDMSLSNSPIPFGHYPAQAMDPTALCLPPTPQLTPGLSLGYFAPSSLQQLPPKHEALELVDEAFRSFMHFYPFYDEQEFMEQFHQEYLSASPGQPEWWANLNVVLSLAHRWRAMRIWDTAYNNALSCAYIHNALAVVSEISLIPNSLPAVQAIFGMALMLQGSPNAQPASVLIATAVRLAQSMGLHRKTYDSSLSDAKTEQRRRVFWLTYILDKDISQRVGQPFSQDDDDMDAELPTESPVILPFICAEGVYTVSFLNTRIGLAIIQGQVYKKLYSFRASQQPPEQRARVAEEINTLLSYWKSGVPLDFEGPTLAIRRRIALPVEMIHLVILRMTYINCLVMVDHHLPRHDERSFDPLLGVPMAGAGADRVALHESRKALRLVSIAPPGDYTCVWIMLHPFYAAATLLLHEILFYPSSRQARTDYILVQPFLELLHVLAREERPGSQSDEAKRLYQSCTALSNSAREAMDQYG